MTGELTLSGDVLAVGGIREKVLAAQQAGVTTVILPHDNERDISEIPPHIIEGLDFVYAEHYPDVFDIALHELAKKVKPQAAAPKKRAPAKKKTPARKRPSAR